MPDVRFENVTHPIHKLGNSTSTVFEVIVSTKLLLLTTPLYKIKATQNDITLNRKLSTVYQENLIKISSSVSFTKSFVRENGKVEIN